MTVAELLDKLDRLPADMDDLEVWVGGTGVGAVNCVGVVVTSGLADPEVAKGMPKKVFLINGYEPK
jgi:hypothetical protein